MKFLQNSLSLQFKYRLVGEWALLFLTFLKSAVCVLAVIQRLAAELMSARDTEASLRVQIVEQKRELSETQQALFKMTQQVRREV